MDTASRTSNGSRSEPFSCDRIALERFCLFIYKNFYFIKKERIWGYHGDSADYENGAERDI